MYCFIEENDESQRHPHLEIFDSDDEEDIEIVFTSDESIHANEASMRKGYTQEIIPDSIPSVFPSLGFSFPYSSGEPTKDHYCDLKLSRPDDGYCQICLCAVVPAEDWNNGGGVKRLTQKACCKCRLVKNL